jgi:hypothetical protein
METTIEGEETRFQMVVGRWGGMGGGGYTSDTKVEVSPDQHQVRVKDDKSSHQGLGL